MYGTCICISYDQNRKCEIVLKKLIEYSTLLAAYIKTKNKEFSYYGWFVRWNASSATPHPPSVSIFRDNYHINASTINDHLPNEDNIFSHFDIKGDLIHMANVDLTTNEICSARISFQIECNGDSSTTSWVTCDVCPNKCNIH